MSAMGGAASTAAPAAAASTTAATAATVSSTAAAPATAAAAPAKVKYDKEELRKRLTAQEFYVTQEKGTERAFTSPLTDLDAAGASLVAAASAHKLAPRPSTRAICSA